MWTIRRIGRKTTPSTSHRAARAGADVWRLIAGTAVALTLALVGCEPVDQNQAADPTAEADYESPTAERTPASDQPMVVHEASFEAGEASQGPVDGTVRVTDPGAGGDLELEVRITGVQPGEHAWHIHEGACTQAGAVHLALSATQGQEGIVDPLNADEQGVIDESVAVPELDRSLFGTGGQYSLHVHEQGGVDHGATVACATL
ncbi:MAG: hypothetical protein ACRELC_14050 [Gemmatimonadota bacterium]